MRESQSISDADRIQRKGASKQTNKLAKTAGRRKVWQIIEKNERKRDTKMK